ncbi:MULTISPECIES: hypothetical protein [Pseudomonas]|uniref:hypothetical protein n=1 Tax=Pseudomonas TaxID=286 RepID=UPI001AE1965C|nr:MULTISPECIES: hypothetical protein [unclassified Pseudomonas]MBP1127147.1 hypothetical protein [Pseudomonas sp. PvP025]MDQ0401007.1 hypothetical protein [Pseudomonas sp. PvP006]
MLEGDENLLIQIRTVISELVFDLKSLPESSFGKGALPMFRNCVIKLNGFEMEIETVERESILDVLYQLGELVGLSRSSEFLEKWRGDW